MTRTDEEVDRFFNDLDGDELQTLLRIIRDLDRLAVDNGTPRYDSREIDLLGKFHDFMDEGVVDDSAVDIDDEDGDTGIASLVNEDFEPVKSL